MKRKACLLMVILLVISLLVAACGKNESGQQNANNQPSGQQDGSSGTIKIGVVGPMTGISADMGYPFFRGVKMAADEINEKGGIAGKKIELIQVDDQGDPSRCVTAVKKLIFEDKVKAILGPNNSGNCLAIKEIVNENKVPTLLNGFVKAIISDNLPYVFRLCADDETNFSFAYDYAKKYKNIGIIHDTAGFGQNTSEVFVKMLAADGRKPAARESYAMGAVDVTAQVLRLKQAKCDFVVWAGAASDAATVGKTMQRLGLKVPMSGNNGIFPSALRIAGTALDGYVYADTMDYDNPNWKAFYEKYSKLYNADWNDTAQHEPCEGYDGMLLLAEGLKKTNGQGGEALKDALESGVSIQGACGRAGKGMSISKDNHTALGKDELTMHVIKDGKYAMWNPEK